MRRGPSLSLPQTTQKVPRFIPLPATNPHASSLFLQITKMVEVCVEAHRTLFPGVPIAGWDLAVAHVVDGKPRMCLLEVNLMCNFFKGAFDKDKYIRPFESPLLSFDCGSA